MEPLKFNGRLKTFLICMALVLVGGGVFITGIFFALNLQHTGGSLGQVQAEEITVPAMGPDTIADMVEKAGPAVVNIETKTMSTSFNDSMYNDPFFQEFFGDNMMRPREYVQNAIGSGFVIDAQGLVLTNQHVIDGATQITVTFSGNKKYNATVLGQDYDLDLAVLKIQAQETFPVLTLGDSDKARVGEWVVAIGNPYGLDHTVTVGVVSAKGRPMKIEGRSYRNLVQTDAAINPGNSGGPLLNTRGEVIGINTAVNTQAQGIGFAISVNTAKEIINELISKGKIERPYMGVYLQSMDENLAKYLGVPAQGALIASVIQGGPAQQAGLQKYDVIISVDGQKIDTADSLQTLLSTKQVGDKIALVIFRNQTEMAVSLSLQEKP